MGLSLGIYNSFLENFLVLNFRVSHSNIFSDGGVKENGFLVNDPDLGPYIFQVVIFDRYVPDGNAALTVVVKTLQQLNDCTTGWERFLKSLRDAA